MRVTASAPGKLILCGEHAVVYRRPALVAAVDLRLRTVLKSDAPHAPDPEATVRLRVPSFGLDDTVTWREVLAYAATARRRWREWAEGRSGDAFAAVRSDDPAHVMKVALGEAVADRGETGGPALAVTVESALPTGSGFGSSAAAAVTLVAAYRALRSAGAEAGAGTVRRGVPSADRPEPTGMDRRELERRELERVERLALEVERRQHGSPSGVDGATVLHGGLVWAERNEAGALCFTPFRAHPSTATPVLGHLAVFDSGTPAEGTGAVVAAVRERAAREPARFDALWDEIEAVTRAIRRLLERPADADAGARATALLRRCQRALEAAGVVPEAVRERVAAVEAAGGAAKISGAGSLTGPGAGSLLVYHSEAKSTGGDPLDGLPALAGLRRHPVRLGGPGLEVTADREAPAGDR